MIDLGDNKFFVTVREPRTAVGLGHPRPALPPRRKKRKHTDPTEECATMAEPSSKTEVKKRSHDQAGDASASNPKESNRKRSNPESKPKKRRKTRIHPSEANHRIGDLPTLTCENNNQNSAAEQTASLGLTVSGKGKSTEVWYAGSEDKKARDSGINIGIDGRSEAAAATK